MKSNYNYSNIGRAVIRRPARGWKRGVTLIELMVAAVIMVVVTGAAFTLFKIATSYEARQQEILTQTQNLRAALYAVSRDIRMAGSGLPLIGSQTIHIYVNDDLYDAETQKEKGWFSYTGANEAGARAIFGTDSGTDETKSDTLTIFRAEVETTSSLGQLSAAFNPGSSNSIRLIDGIWEGELFSDGDILAIANGTAAVIVQAAVSTPGQKYSEIGLGPRFNPEKTLSGDTFPAGSMVYNLRDVTFVTYYVDTANKRLMANYHDVTLKDEDADDPNKHLVTVADNIEDFQVAYFLRSAFSENLTQYSTISLDQLANQGLVVQAVQVAMVSRSKNTSQLNPEGSSVKVMEHTAKDEKGYTRRVLSEIVQLRNY